MARRESNFLSVIGTKRVENPGNPGEFWYFESHFNRIERCEVFDVGGHGIFLGDRFIDISNWETQMTTASEPSEFNEVVDSKIHRFGQVYADALGIYIGNVRNTLIKNNEIAFGRWSGISVGNSNRHETEIVAFGCGPFPRNTEGTRIEHNLIYRVMHGLSDGGAIYSVGNHRVSPEEEISTLHGNYIRSMQPDPTLSHHHNINGLYFDRGAGHWHVTRNYTANVWRQFHFNHGAGNQTNPPCMTPGTFGTFAALGAVVNFTMECPSTPGQTRHFIGQHWYTQTYPVDLRNRWFSPPQISNWDWYYGRYHHFEEFFGQCHLKESHPNSFVLVSNYNDSAAQAIATEAGPADRDAWFPFTGERIYPLPRRCHLRCEPPNPTGFVDPEDPGADDDLSEVFWP